MTQNVAVSLSFSLRRFMISLFFFSYNCASKLSENPINNYKMSYRNIWYSFITSAEKNKTNIGTFFFAQNDVTVILQQKNLWISHQLKWSNLKKIWNLLTLKVHEKVSAIQKKNHTTISEIQAPPYNTSTPLKFRSFFGLVTS